MYGTIEEVKILTPADQRKDDDVSGGDLDKDDDQFLEHEHSLCPHPHHRHQCEVLDQSRHSHTASEWIRLVNARHKHNQHTANGDTELNVELGSITYAQLPKEHRRNEQTNAKIAVPLT